MATSIGTYYGNSVGPYGKFRVVCQLRYTDTDSSKGWYVQRRFYVQVTKGESSVWTSTLLPSWTSTRYSLSTAGTYADSGWKNVGWIAYGSTVSYSCSAQYTGGSGTVYKSSLSGNYTVPKPTYKVAYNANGGSGAPSSQTKTYGTNLTLSSTKPTRTGYTFQGWGTSASDTTVDYAAGATYSANAAITLYAIWKINTYTVAYNANGGSGAPSSQTKTYGTNLTLSSTKPTRTGYTFQGWGTSASDTTVDYAAGATYSANVAITLYAIWKINTYTVAYNANGGSGAPSSQTKTYGKTLTLSSTKPVKTGYKFTGWNTSADGSGTTYAAGGSYTGNAALTLYAMWEIEANCYMRLGGNYQMGLMYVKQNGTYKRGTVALKNGTYKNTNI